jgi:hypothetical protein
MQNRNSPLCPEVWLNDLFTCKAVQQGGVIRRKRRDVERFVGMEAFLQEVNHRGFHVAKTRANCSSFATARHSTGSPHRPRFLQKKSDRNLFKISAPP